MTRGQRPVAEETRARAPRRGGANHTSSRKQYEGSEGQRQAGVFRVVEEPQARVQPGVDGVDSTRYENLHVGEQGCWRVEGCLGKVLEDSASDAWLTQVLTTTGGTIVPTTTISRKTARSGGGGMY